MSELFKFISSFNLKLLNNTVIHKHYNKLAARHYSLFHCSKWSTYRSCSNFIWFKRFYTLVVTK